MNDEIKAGDLVHERGIGGPTMTVISFTDGTDGRFAHCEYRDSENGHCVSTFREEFLALVVSFDPLKDGR